jgi:hypothetical protein
LAIEIDPVGRRQNSRMIKKGILLFQEKEAKSVSSASQKVIPYLNLGEADPGGLGACPQNAN